MSQRKTVPLPPTLKKAAVCFSTTTYLTIVPKPQNLNLQHCTNVRLISDLKLF
jgi:hypothetical protein